MGFVASNPCFFCLWLTPPSSRDAPVNRDAITLEQVIAVAPDALTLALAHADQVALLLTHAITDYCTAVLPTLEHIRKLRVHALLPTGEPDDQLISRLKRLEECLLDADAPQVTTVANERQLLEHPLPVGRAVVQAEGSRQFLSLQAAKFAIAEHGTLERMTASVTDLTYEGLPDSARLLLVADNAGLLQEWGRALLYTQQIIPTF